ncbi:MAG TPA: hypothetical protein VNQ80_14055 [Parapedobacter sp.]|uniref:hypothetical protein n=1 Tax=Parapedobacter sp. TaxID=1958893 RepID=UPI002CF68025|nr:hypothetical protein [Parapedobacter sp.]HWK58463.1 hypothetical protein [Parapedobacter sp.]
MTAKIMERIKAIAGIGAVLIGLLAGCATQKLSADERLAWQVRGMEMSGQERHLRRQEQTMSASIRMEYVNNVAEIIPVGAFRLSADSGYLGQAERVVIHRESRRLDVAESNGAVAAVDRSAAMAATREDTALQWDTRMRQQEADVSPLLKIPWWAWLCGVCGVIYLVARLLKG